MDTSLVIVYSVHVVIVLCKLMSTDRCLNSSFMTSRGYDMYRARPARHAAHC